MPVFRADSAPIIEQSSSSREQDTAEDEGSDAEAGDNPLLGKRTEDSVEEIACHSGRLHEWWTGTGQGISRWIWDSGISCMLIASFIQALSAVLVKCTGGRVPVFEIVAVRSGICTAATIAIIKARGISPTFGSPQYLLPLFMRGFTGAASMSFYYFGLFKLNLADCMTIFFSNPAMTVALAWALRGERVSCTGLIGIVASLLGVVLVAQPPFLTGSGPSWSSEHLTGVLCSVSAAFLAASAFVSIRYIPKSEASFSVALWFHALGFASAVLPLLVGVPEWPVVPAPLDCACILGVACTSLSSHFFIARAFLVDQASKVASVGYTQVLYGTIFGFVLLNESVTLLSILGSLVICMGVVAVSWPSKPAAIAAQKDIQLSDGDAEVLELSHWVEDDLASKVGQPSASGQSFSGRGMEEEGTIPGDDVRWPNKQAVYIAAEASQESEAALAGSQDLLEAAEEGQAINTAFKK